MNIFIFDATFEGLLTAIYEAYYNEVKPQAIYSSLIYEPNLIDNPINIETDLDKFQKVYNAIESKISKKSLQKIYYCYLSETKESSNLIFSYIRMGFKIGKDIELHKNNDTVLNIDKLAKRVSLERHRFTGFVRFKEINNILYSSIEPDFNILGLLGNHFKNRLTNEYFIINDAKRNIALVYNKDDYYLTTLDSNMKALLENSYDTGEYSDLWRQYFKSTNIKERANSRLQKRSMPTRYWKNLTELN